MADIAISARELSKRFTRHTERRMALKERVVRGSAPAGKDFWALRDVSFDVARGTTFGIIGHPGSGKSTALKVLTGVYRPSSGVVEVNGRVSALLELGAGFHPELTGRENVVLNGSILGLSAKQIDATMDDIIDFSGIEAFIDTPVKHYSSGMTLRLGFAIAVKLDPEILIVDEVIAVGDEQFQRKCMDYLHSLRLAGSTIMIVSHSMSQIETMCDEVVWLDHGEVRAIGPSYEVVAKYLDAVNEDERQQRSKKKAMVRGAPRATGSGEIRVHSVEFLNADGQADDVLTSGQPARVRMYYEAGMDLPSAVFGFMLHSETGQPIAGRNSFHSIDVPVSRGTGSVEFDMPALPVLGGNYLVSTMVSDGAHIFDSRDRDFEVTIRSNDVSAAGLVRIPGEWRISPDPPATA